MKLLNLKAEEPTNETILSALYSFGLVLLSFVFTYNITQIGLISTIFYFLPFLIAVHYIGIDELGRYLLKKYRPKTDLENFLVISLIILVAGYYFVEPVIDSLFPKSVVAETLIIRSWSAGYLVYLVLLGKIFGMWTSVIFNRTLLTESEYRSKQLLKASNCFQGIFLLPFTYATLIDLGIWLPLNTFFEIGNLGLSLAMAVTGITMFIGIHEKTLKHSVLFFYTDKHYDQYRILRKLYNNPLDKKSLEKAVENKDKFDTFLNGWIKNGMIIKRGKKFYLSEKILKIAQ